MQNCPILKHIEQELIKNNLCVMKRDDYLAIWHKGTAIFWKHYAYVSIEGADVFIWTDRVFNQPRTPQFNLSDPDVFDKTIKKVKSYFRTEFEND